MHWITSLNFEKKLKANLAQSIKEEVMFWLRLSSPSRLYSNATLLKSPTFIISFKWQLSVFLQALYPAHFFPFLYHLWITSRKHHRVHVINAMSCTWYVYCLFSVLSPPTPANIHTQMWAPQGKRLAYSAPKKSVWP